MRYYVPRIFALVALLQICPTTGWSGEKRVLDFTNEGSTSRCIGDPRTPMCAAETLEACRIRAEWKLCEPIEHNYSVYGRGVPAGYALLIYFRYEILASRLLKARDLEFERLGRSAKPWRIDDVALRLWWEGCPPISSCVVETQMHATKKYGEGCRSFANCDKDPHPRTYILRRKGSRWIVVADYFGPVLPAPFWNRK